MEQRPAFPPRPRPRGPYPVLALLSEGYPSVWGRLLTCYAPVRHCTQGPKSPFSYDLHVLSTPPAFVLSQDQTLRTNFISAQPDASAIRHALQGLSRRAYESYSDCQRTQNTSKSSVKKHYKCLAGFLRQAICCKEENGQTVQYTF